MTLRPKALGKAKRTSKWPNPLLTTATGGIYQTLIGLSIVHGNLPDFYRTITGQIRHGVAFGNVGGHMKQCLCKNRTKEIQAALTR